MGVWDMMYLMQQHRKALEHADNLAFSTQTRAQFSIEAENLRDQMARYMARVEKLQELQESLKEKNELR
jgi:hypothetical protein